MPNRLPLHNLDQSGATEGQVPTWSDEDQAYVPATPMGGGGGGDTPTTALIPLVAVVDGEPGLVFDADGQLVMTEVPL